MRTLLIVDDNPSVLSVLGFFLGTHYRVLVANSGLDALEVFRVESVDIALVDLNMPGMNGVQTCEALLARAREQGRSFPIWGMTGAFCADVKQRFIQAGAIDLLAKPFNMPELIATLERPFVDKQQTLVPQSAIA